MQDACHWKRNITAYIVSNWQEKQTKQSNKGKLKQNRSLQSTLNESK